jgi:hypothetical protein
MALGAFALIVRFRILGTTNYVHGGRGDGLFILSLSAIIIACVRKGYWRIAAAAGVAAAHNPLKAYKGIFQYAGQVVERAKDNPSAGWPLPSSTV